MSHVEGSMKEVVSQPVYFKERGTSAQRSSGLFLLVKTFSPSAFITIDYTRCCRAHRRNRRHGR